MNKILNFTLKNSKKSLSVTPNHYVHIKRNNETTVIHVPSYLAQIGDSFLVMNDSTQTFEFDEIESITTQDVHNYELISIYTDSLTLIGNGILASSKSEYDGIEWTIGTLTFISKYISVDLA